MSMQIKVKAVIMAAKAEGTSVFLVNGALPSAGLAKQPSLGIITQWLNDSFGIETLDHLNISEPRVLENKIDEGIIFLVYMITLIGEFIIEGEGKWHNIDEDFVENMNKEDLYIMERA